MISPPVKVRAALEIPQSGILEASFAKNFPLSILIAEDNFVNQKLIERILQKLGYQPDIASDGVQVLNFSSQKEYDVILMDLRMPGMDGYEATRRIRQGTLTQPYIIAMTANAMSNDKVECFQNGMNDFVSKPICITEVISKLRTAYNYRTGNE
jgi:CheY-like chemotaxis protein